MHPCTVILFPHSHISIFFNNPTSCKYLMMFSLQILITILSTVNNLILYSSINLILCWYMLHDLEVLFSILISSAVHFNFTKISNMLWEIGNDLTIQNSKYIYESPSEFCLHNLISLWWYVVVTWTCAHMCPRFYVVYN